MRANDEREVLDACAYYKHPLHLTDELYGEAIRSLTDERLVYSKFNEENRTYTVWIRSYSRHSWARPIRKV